MQKQTLSIFLTLGLAVLLAGSSVFASSSGMLRANIPFDFMAGGKKFQSGEYTVSSTNTPSVLLVRSLNSRTAAFVLTDSVSAPGHQDKAKFVFRRYGSQYFLAQIWDGTSDDGREVPPSQQEKSLAKEESKHLAQKAMGPDLVSIAAQ